MATRRAQMTAEEARSKSWWTDVDHVDVECHISDHEVHIAEYAAIASESPLHNKHGVAS